MTLCLQVTEYNDCLEIGDRSKDESKMVAYLAFYQVRPSVH